MKDRFEFNPKPISTRLKQMNKNSVKVEDLSRNYSNAKLDEFMRHKENLILMEYFIES